jgi:hypothetical protein
MKLETIGFERQPVFKQSFFPLLGEGLSILTKVQLLLLFFLLLCFSSYSYSSALLILLLIIIVVSFPMFFTCFVLFFSFSSHYYYSLILIMLFFFALLLFLLCILCFFLFFSYSSLPLLLLVYYYYYFAYLFSHFSHVRKVLRFSLPTNGWSGEKEADGWPMASIRRPSDAGKVALEYVMQVMPRLLQLFWLFTNNCFSNQCTISTCLPSLLEEFPFRDMEHIASNIGLCHSPDIPPPALSLEQMADVPNHFLSPL